MKTPSKTTKQNIRKPLFSLLLVSPIYQMPIISTTSLSKCNQHAHKWATHLCAFLQTFHRVGRYFRMGEKVPKLNPFALSSVLILAASHSYPLSANQTNPSLKQTSFASNSSLMEIFIVAISSEQIIQPGGQCLHMSKASLFHVAYVICCGLICQWKRSHISWKNFIFKALFPVISTNSLWFHYQ